MEDDADHAARQIRARVSRSKRQQAHCAKQREGTYPSALGKSVTKYLNIEHNTSNKNKSSDIENIFIIQPIMSTQSEISVATTCTQIMT